MSSPNPADPLLTRLQAQLQAIYAREEAAGPAIPWPPLPRATTSWQQRLVDEPERRHRALAQVSGGRDPLDDATWQRRQHRARRGRGEAPREGEPTGATIRQARELEGLSQRQLAKVRRISRGWLADIEGGRRRVPPELVVWATLVLRRHERLQESKR